MISPPSLLRLSAFADGPAVIIIGALHLDRMFRICVLIGAPPYPVPR